MDRYRQFYNSYEWKKIASYVIQLWKDKRVPCHYCGKPIERGQRAICDHIQPLKEQWDLRSELTNLRAMHHQCHSRHTLKRSGPEIGADGFPVGTDWEGLG